FVIGLRVGAENAGRVDCQRAVDVDLQIGRQIPVLDQVVQAIDQLLSSADGKSGDNYLAALLHGVANDVFQQVVGVLVGRVLTVAIGALQDQNIGLIDEHRIVENWPVGAAEVAAEDQTRGLAVSIVLNIEAHDGRAQYMAGVVERQRNAGGHMIGTLVADAQE